MKPRKNRWQGGELTIHICLLWFHWLGILRTLWRSLKAVPMHSPHHQPHQRGSVSLIGLLGIRPFWLARVATRNRGDWISGTHGTGRNIVGLKSASVSTLIRSVIRAFMNQWIIYSFILKCFQSFIIGRTSFFSFLGVIPVPLSTVLDPLTQWAISPRSMQFTTRR